MSVSHLRIEWNLVSGIYKLYTKGKKLTISQLEILFKDILEKAKEAKRKEKVKDQKTLN